MYASLSRFFFGTRIQINVSWIRIRTRLNDTDPTGSETLVETIDVDPFDLDRDPDPVLVKNAAQDQEQKIQTLFLNFLFHKKYNR